MKAYLLTSRSTHIPCYSDSGVTIKYGYVSYIGIFSFLKVLPYIWKVFEGHISISQYLYPNIYLMSAMSISIKMKSRINITYISNL
ncbi:hematological/neurological-like protein [Gossypium australe]|uniref:Hematological/neurological-like protein n=1 Tax=Gossypium australe TaxID=47621 RepID=A0A5B6W3B6_9ROSI|nr:hematological/neurological-like protein [Gossypium australe]